MMSDFFESFLTPPPPLNPIFTFYNPIFLDAPSPPKIGHHLWTIPKEKKNVFECFHNDTEKYWKYQYISIYFLILGIDIDIRIFPVKKYNIDIWRIKRYFTVPKYWFM